MGTFGVVLGTLGVGGLLGFWAGSTVRTVSRLMGCLLGLVFILMQVLAFYGLAEWHWDRIGQALAGPGASAVTALSRWLWKVLTYNLPFTGGFAVGFYLGLRRS